MKDIDNFIKKVDATISSLLDSGSLELKRLFLDGSLCRGKRLRAKFFYIFSESQTGCAVKTAAVIEMMHAATLIHDDIIDRSLLRRGKPVLHSKNTVTDAVLYGDYLFSSAFNLLSELGSAEIFQHLTGALAAALKGEILENSSKRDSKLSSEKYFSIIEQKSGALFGAACQLGAIVKGADKECAEKAKVFGINTGIAYQLADDYLDYFGKCEGKEKFKDVREGVVTLPFIFLMRNGTPEDRQKAANLITNTSLPLKDAEQAALLIQNLGIPDLVLLEIKKYRDVALKSAPEYALDMLRKYSNLLNWVSGN